MLEFYTRDLRRDLFHHLTPQKRHTQKRKKKQRCQNAFPLACSRRVGSNKKVCLAAHAAVAPVCSALKQLLRRRVRRVLFYIFIIIKKMWTEWASSSFRTDARLKQRGFVVVVEIVVDIAAAAETREDPSSSQK